MTVVLAVLVGGMLSWLVYRQLLVSLLLKRAAVCTDYGVAGMMISSALLWTILSREGFVLAILGVSVGIGSLLVQRGIWIVVNCQEKRIFDMAERVLGGMFLPYQKRENSIMVNPPHACEVRLISSFARLHLVRIKVDKETKKITLFRAALRKFLTAA